MLVMDEYSTIYLHNLLLKKRAKLLTVEHEISVREKSLEGLDGVKHSRPISEDLSDIQEKRVE